LFICAKVGGMPIFIDFLLAIHDKYQMLMIFIMKEDACSIFLMLFYEVNV